MLGRPYTIRRDSFDVELPRSTNDEGSFDVFGFNHRIMIELAVLVGEAIDEVRGRDLFEITCILIFPVVFQRPVPIVHRVYRHGHSV